MTRFERKVCFLCLDKGRCGLFFQKSEPIRLCLFPKTPQRQRCDFDASIARPQGPLVNTVQCRASSDNPVVTPPRLRVPLSFTLALTDQLISSPKHPYGMFPPESPPRRGLFVFFRRLLCPAQATDCQNVSTPQGWKLVGLKMLTPGRQLVESHYEEHADKVGGRTKWVGWYRT